MKNPVEKKCDLILAACKNSKKFKKMCLCYAPNASSYIFEKFETH